MKKIFKWQWSTFLALMILVVLTVALTGRQMAEETSKMGKTAKKATNAVTYIKDADCSIETPKDWKRYFQDSGNTGVANYLKQSNILFAATTDDEIYMTEVYLDQVKGKEAFADIENLDEATKEQVDAFVQTVKAQLANQVAPYVLVGELDCEVIELGGHKFVRTYYCRKATAFAEFDVVSDYMTISKGHIVDISNYFLSGKDEDPSQIIPGLDDLFVPLMENFEYGDATKNLKPAASAESLWGKISSFTFAIWVFLIPLLYFFIYGAEIGTEKKAWHDDVLSLSSSKSLLGFFAILIVFHHLTQTIGAGNSSVFAILENFGVCFVGAFFFFSGYGLLLSLHNKPGYLKGFFKKRLPSILVPFYVCILIFIIAALVTGKEFTIPQFIGWVTGFILLNTHMWYIVEIALFYIMFYVIFRFIKKENVAICLMGLFLVVFTVGSLLLGHGDFWFQGEWWFNSSLLFLVGMIFAKCQNRILPFFKKWYAVSIAVVLAGFIVFYKLTVYMLNHYSYWSETELDPGYADKFRCLGAQLPMIILFMVLVVLIGMKVKFKNKVLDYFGKISLELYLIHNIFLTYATPFTGNGMFVTVVIIGSIIFAAFIHELDDIIICKILKKKRPPKKKMWPEFKASFTDTIFKFKYYMGYAKRNPKTAFKYVWREIICFFITVITIIPIYIMFINATRTSISLVKGISFIPEGQFMDNLSIFITKVEDSSQSIMGATTNSCIIAICYCILATYFGAMTAYGFELFKFKGKKILWCMVVGALMISPLASFIGLYQLLLKINLINSFLPLIIPAIATPSTVFFMRMYLKTLRLNEIVEAARIDGCSEYGIFNRIILPAIKPALSLQIIFTYVSCWNNSFAQGMLLQENSKKTIAIYMRSMAGNNGASSDPVTYVMLLLTTLPPLIVYILFSKSIVSRIVLGAVKE